MPLFRPEALPYMGYILFQIMSDLSPVMRLATALASIRDSPLAPMVLNPASIAQPLPTNDHERLKIKRKAGGGLVDLGGNFSYRHPFQASIQYRDDQLKAIAVCLNEISDIQKPVLRLISGAAGSGKSQAVVGLVEEIQLVRTIVSLWVSSNEAIFLFFYADETSKATRRCFHSRGQTRKASRSRIGIGLYRRESGRFVEEAFGVEQVLSAVIGWKS